MNAKHYVFIRSPEFIYTSMGSQREVSPTVSYAQFVGCTTDASSAASACSNSASGSLRDAEPNALHDSSLHDDLGSSCSTSHEFNELSDASWRAADAHSIAASVLTLGKCYCARLPE